MIKLNYYYYYCARFSATFFFLPVFYYLLYYFRFDSRETCNETGCWQQQKFVSNDLSFVFIVKRLWICRMNGRNREELTMSIAIISVRHTAKSFLTSCNIQFNKCDYLVQF